MTPTPAKPADSLPAAPTRAAADPRRPGWVPWLLLLPLLLWLATFVVAPTAIMAVYSFSKPGPLGTVEYSGTWANYGRIINLSTAAQIFGAASLRWLVVAPLVLLLAAAAAWPLGWYRHRTDNTRAAAAAFVAFALFDVARALLGFSPGYFHSAAAILSTFLAASAYAAACFVVPERWLYRREPAVVLVVALLIALFLLQLRSAALQAEAVYVGIFVRSLDYALVSTAICIVFGYPVAYFIGRAPVRARNLLLIAVMIPFWTNFLIRTYAWITILNRQGLLNATIESFNSLIAPLNIGQVATVDVMYTPVAVMIGLVYTYLPFMILPIYGSVEKLDGSMVEAALDLGATPWQAFWRVIVPLTRPGIVAGFLLVFIPAIGQFAINDILGGKIDPIVGNTIEKQFGAALNKPFGAALGMTLLVMFVACFALFRREEERA